MFPRIALSIFLVTSAGVASAEMKDYKGYKDPALFTRLPHYFLTGEGSFTDKPFDSFEFFVKNGTERVEGHHLYYDYYYDESAGNQPSTLQIIRNYEAAAKRIGGQILNSGDLRTTIRVTANGREIWVALQAYNDGREYDLHVIERETMRQDVIADAGALKSGLKDTGHVEVPGIFFDFGKSEVKSESDRALKEVVNMLRANPAVKVWVVGHTDNAGSVESNMTLSSARAAAVVKSLQAMGIDAKRLAAHGAGPYAPVASNASEEGRARNRRVELVAQF